MSENDVRVVDVPDRRRFEILVDGKRAGFAAYRRREQAVELTHTEVDPAYQGQGLAGRLAAAALDQARADGLRVVPTCPYIASYIESHPDYADLVDGAA
jgi:predicted GNAT family acetyltransferase